MEKINKVAIITNYNITEKALAAATVADKFIKFDCEVLIFASAKERLSRLRRLRPEFVFASVDEVYAGADILVILGGDGTILEGARRAALTGTPILGINLGRLGFMAELEMDEIGLLSRLFDGNYSIDERAMLGVEMIDTKGQRKLASFALNDAVVTGGSVARIVDLELLEGGEQVTTYRADGLIVATPTGSTAYSMSAGGAICDPSLACFCVTPICPHSLTAKPMVFAGDAKLAIKNIHVRDKKLLLTVDGKMTYDLYRGDVVQIEKSSVETKLVRFCSQGFYSTLRQKMNAD